MIFRPEITAMTGYVPGEQPHDTDTIKLNTNENPYRASEKVFEAIRTVIEKGLSRYPDPTASVVRKIVGEKFAVPPDWVLCGNGSDDLLTILTRTFVGADELLRLPEPSYVLYKNLAEIQGAKSETVLFNPDWTLPKQFRKNTDGLRLVFLPNPNSPSGTVLPKQQVLDIAETLPCPLVIDEAYADFADENCTDLVQHCEKIIITRTLSKSYSLAGLRFGFLIAQPHIIEQMLKVKDSYNCDVLSIAAAAAALSDDDWLAENRRKIIATRTSLTQSVRELGFTVPDSQANFVWAGASMEKAGRTTERNVSGIYEYLKQHGLLVRYMKYPNAGEGLRISVGTDEQVQRCVKEMKNYRITNGH